MTINCKGKILNFDSPIVMGILNVTPDSFFDGGQNLTEKDFLLKTEKMISEGASIIDVGGYSSKPNANKITEEIEINRIIKPIELLTKHFPDLIISIDTYRSNVAQQAINVGACIINDISAGELDKNMFSVVKKNQVPYIIMHMQGNPSNMQNKPNYNNVTRDIYKYLSKKIALLREIGINDIILDPGFGFGKTIDHNYELLNNLSFFKTLNIPILTGISRKSMIYKPLNINPKEALNGTTALNMISLQKGSNILRVHDVKQAMECIKLFKLINNK